jgi:hypothetical protein
MPVVRIEEVGARDEDALSATPTIWQWTVVVHERVDRARGEAMGVDERGRLLWD